MAFQKRHDAALRVTTLHPWLVAEFGVLSLPRKMVKLSLAESGWLRHLILHTTRVPWVTAHAVCMEWQTASCKRMGMKPAYACRYLGTRGA